MTQLDRENITVTVNAWRHHRTNHRIGSDPQCVFCDDDPRFQPGHMWDHQANVIYAQGD